MGDAGKSAIAEHQWDQQHQVNWEGTRVLDRASRSVQLRVKEALYIQKTPTNKRLNRDEGYELPGCWIATVKRLGGGVSSSRASANRVSAYTSARTGPHARASSGATPINCHHFSFSHLASEHLVETSASCTPRIIKVVHKRLRCFYFLGGGGSQSVPPPPPPPPPPDQSGPGSVSEILASYPGSRGGGEREPGTHCLRMRLIYRHSGNSVVL